MVYELRCSYQTWHSWIRASWYDYENNQQDVLYRLIYYSKFIHVSGDVFAHHQEHLTVFTVSGSVHPSCCRHQPAATWVNANTVNTNLDIWLAVHHSITFLLLPTWYTNFLFIHTNYINPLKPELIPIGYLLALLGDHQFLHVSRIRVKLLTFRLLMSYIYGAPILDVSRSHTTTQHSR